MHRARWAVLLLLLAGCQAPPERVPVMPLPQEGEPVSYADLLQRARFQAAAANEAFYVDQWAELQEAAAALEKTTRYLPRADDVPAEQKAELPRRVEELTQLTGQLRDAARAKDVKKANEALQQINLKIRELKPAAK